MGTFAKELQAREETVGATVLFFGYLAALLRTSAPIGFMRDEGFYFSAARSYEAWFELLARQPKLALSSALIDRFWGVNHEHPALIKTLFALCHALFHEKLGWFSHASSSFRFPSMVLSSLAVALVFVWGRRRFGFWPGLVAALSFGFMPHVFFHAHLACFDLPVASLWLVNAFAYARALVRGGHGAALSSALCYGLLLDTKHNAWLFPAAVLLHFVATAGTRAMATQQLSALRPPLVWAYLLTVSPLVFYALWPWLWRDPLARFLEYVNFHRLHEFYNIEFLGRTYHQPPMPRAYAPLMTLATVPAITLALFAIGLASLGRTIGSSLRLAAKRRPNAADPALRAEPASIRSSEMQLWAALLFISYAPWLSNETPIFGGTKHWFTAYPMLALIAAAGFRSTFAALERSCGPRAWLGPVLAGAVLVGPLAMTLHAGSFGLGFYTAAVGGAPGAASLGLNRTFWGYTTANLLPFVNARAPRGGTVYVHDTALESFAMLQEDGFLRRDLRGGLNIAASRIALYHHEPHMSRVEQQIWLEYGRVAPEGMAVYDGVPIAWAYAR